MEVLTSNEHDMILVLETKKEQEGGREIIEAYFGFLDVAEFILWYQCWHGQQCLRHYRRQENLLPTVSLNLWLLLLY